MPIPNNFKEDDEHYDSNVVFKSTLKKYIEPTAWSRAKGIAGMDVRENVAVDWMNLDFEDFRVGASQESSSHATSPKQSYSPKYKRGFVKTTLTLTPPSMHSTNPGT